MVQAPESRSILCVQSDSEPCAFVARALPIYNCVFRANAYDAVRSLHTQVFAAYVLDYWLPDWTGPALCREIRKYDPHGPVLFLTTARGENEQKRAMRAGASGYLCRPVEPDALAATVESLVTESDLRSLRAKAEAEETVRDVFKRSARAAPAGVTAPTPSIERIARVHAYKAFISSGGTRCHFENWWPQVFSGARAEFELR